MTAPESKERQAALAAAVLGEALILAVRSGLQTEVEKMLLPGSPSWLALDIFGVEFLRLLLRLDDPREEGKLAPYDLQIENEVALLELGVVTKLPVENAADRSHLLRVFGSGILLTADHRHETGWLVEEIFPVNSDGQLRPDDPTDARILQVMHGQEAWPLRLSQLDPIERAFLQGMQAQPGRFLLEELFNAVRLWRDFQGIWPEEASIQPPREWAAGVEYLITVFDYHHADPEALATRYQVEAEAVTDTAREIAATLQVTQFDDRYSIHPDPVAHYRELFNELGINPKRDEEIARQGLTKVFDFVEVPPDDDTFFGPS